ncbi:MAG: hypothetical protein GY771_16945 [bacterium]|nr:hypothetical protein [bacterium]
MQIFLTNHPDALFIDVGNLCNEEDTVLTRFKAETLREIYTASGYDAVNAGINELVFADIYLNDGSGENAVPFVSSNIEGLPEGISRYTDINCGGIVIRVTGVVADKKIPDLLKEEGYQKEKAKKRVKDIAKADGDYDLLVVLASNCDASYERKLAFDVRKHCDVIIAGGGVGYVPTGFTDIEDIITVYSPQWSRYIGEIIISLNDNNDVIGWKNTYYPVTENTMKDKRVEQILDNYYEELFAIINTQNLLATPTEIHPSGDKFTGNETCIECHRTQNEQWTVTEHSLSYQSLLDEAAFRNPECVECHVTGYSYVGGFDPSAPREGFDNVGCEECHGPGSAHVSSPGENATTSVTEDTCRRCHSGINSPEFEYDSYRGRIVH